MTTDARSAWRRESQKLKEHEIGTYPRSCALTATAPAKRGPTISDDRPAAAAAASRWPRFDFREVHCTNVDSMQSARTAAPTYKMPIIRESTRNSNIPRSDRPEQFRCRAPRGSKQSCCRNSHFLSGASETSRLAPSSSRLGHPTVRRTREHPRRMLIQLLRELHSTLRRGCTHLLAGRMCGIARELRSFLPRRSRSS